MEENLKVAKYDPLTFECEKCGEHFSAFGKSAIQLSDEIKAHMTDKHAHLVSAEPNST